MQHKISPQEKLKAVEDYLSGNGGISKICSEFWSRNKSSPRLDTKI